MALMHEIDYTIVGDDMQFVEVELDPKEAAVAEAGGMMYMDDGVEMETIFGDGRARAETRRTRRGLGPRRPGRPPRRRQQLAGTIA